MAELNFDSIQAGQERQRREDTFDVVLPLPPARDEVGSGRKQGTIIAPHRNTTLDIAHGFSRQAPHPYAQRVAKLEVAANAALRGRHPDVPNQDLLACRRKTDSG